MGGFIDNFLAEIAAAAVIALVSAAFYGRTLWRWIRSRRALPPSGTHFTILIADLANDGTARQQTAHVTEALRDLKGVRVRRFGRALSIDDHGDQTGALAASELVGRQWLADQNADLLVWGAVAKADHVLRLRFLSRHIARGEHNQSYRLSRTLDLPRDFSVDLSRALAATALIALEPTAQVEGQYLIELLRPVVLKLQNLLASPPSGMDRNSLAKLQIAFGEAARRLGYEAGEPAWINEAISACRNAAEYWAGSSASNFGYAQATLGDALVTLGIRESATEKLHLAIAAYEAAASAFSSDGLPSQAALVRFNRAGVVLQIGHCTADPSLGNMAIEEQRAAIASLGENHPLLIRAQLQIALGTALTIVGELQEDKAKLKESISVLQKAIQIISQDAHPTAWARAQDSLGNALRALGGYERDATILQDAVTAYRASLTVRTVRQYPLDWATTQGNLAAALVRLMEQGVNSTRRSGIRLAALLFMALRVLHRLEKSFSRGKHPHIWAGIKQSLGTTFFRAGVHSRGTFSFRAAAEAYRDALKERTRDLRPLDWAATSGSLATVLVALAGRTKSVQSIEEATAIYRELLDVYSRERYPLFWAQTQRNLGNVHVTMAQVGRSTLAASELKKAAEAYYRALDVYEEKILPSSKAHTQHDLGHALQILSTHEDESTNLQKSIALYEDSLVQLRRESSICVTATQQSLSLAIQSLQARRGEAIAPLQ